MTWTQEESLADWIETLQRYEQHGIPPGDCCLAFLSNDLFGMLARADVNTQANILKIGQYIWNAMDLRCWGSEQKVKDWIMKKRDERKTATQEEAD